MVLFSQFRKGNKPEKIANELGPFLVQVAVHECETFQNVWQRNLDDHSQVALFAEVVIILVAVADRLAFDKLGDPVRTQIMNLVVDTIRDSFANQSYFGETTQDRISFFEQLFSNRIQMYSSCSSIMGEGQDSVIFIGARHLVEVFLDDIQEAELPVAVLETGKALSKSVISLLTTPPFKPLSEKL